MKLKIYSIKDTKIGFMAPFYSHNDGVATRDFTMNALAYSDEDGLIDYNTGVMDIKNRIIKVYFE